MREVAKSDERAMRRALDLAASVRASTSPNPWVGCVISPGGFEGATQPPGGPHAEIVALEQAGEAARGATMVVTLEPCAHHGRTPPCVDAIIGAGIARVVSAAGGRDPLRVVLGKAPPDAKVQPAVELEGDLDEVLDELGRRGVVQAVVEGGPTVAGAFHRAGLVDRYVIYLAPALFGGDDGRPLFAGAGAPTMADVWRGEIVSVEQLGPDVRLEVGPSSPG